MGRLNVTDLGALRDALAETKVAAKLDCDSAAPGAEAGVGSARIFQPG